MRARIRILSSLPWRGFGLSSACAAAIWAASIEPPVARTNGAWASPANPEAGALHELDGPMLADIQMPGPLPAKILRVIDGDTVEVRVQVWLGQAVQTRVRLRGIDAPEINGACGAERDRALAARDRLDSLVRDKPVWLADIGRDKYFGRVVARLVQQDGSDMGDQLVQAGLARPYEGGARKAWCRWGS